jgi:O-antigen/teichoic acid export membrane protein
LGQEHSESSSTLTDVVRGSTRASLFLVVGNVAATVIQAIGVLFVARILGPELYGVYTITLIVPNLALLFCDVGIDAALVKLIASPPEEGSGNRAKLLRTGLLLKFSFSIVVMILCMIFSEALAVNLLNRPYIVFYLRLASLTIIFQALINSSSNAFIGLGKTEYSAIVNNTQAIGKVLIASSLVIIGFGVFGALVGFVIGYLIGIVAALLLFYKSYRQIDNVKDDTKSYDVVRSILRYGLPIFITNILAGIGAQYQSIILATFVPNDAVGNFNASMNFISLMGAISTPISLSIFQGFSKLSKKGQVARSFFMIATKYTTLLMVPLALLIALFARELIVAIYGTSYNTAALYLSFYSLITLLSGLGSLTLSGLFNGLGETKIFLRMGLVSSLVLFVLAPLLTNFFGVVGLISAIFTSSLANTVVGLYFASSKLDLKLSLKELGRTYAALILPALLTFLTLQATPVFGLLKVVIGGILYVMVYLTLLVILRVVNRSDLDKIGKVASRMMVLRYIMQPILEYMSFILSRLKTTKELAYA